MSAWLNALIAELEPADRSQGRQHPQARQFASESHRFKTNSSITVCKGWSPVRVPPRARMTPRQRGFCFNVCTKLVGGVPLTLVRGLCLAAAMAYAGVWRGGFRTLAGWTSACPGVGLCGSSLWFCLVGRGGQHLFIVMTHGYNMTLPALVRNFLEGSLLDVLESCRCPACPAKEGVDSVHTYV
jgi:hypothetical protein